MLRIVRDKEGRHFVDGEWWWPSGIKEYRKKTLTKAVRMTKPFSIETLEGTMEGKAGDYLMIGVIGVNGEMYPCDADIFAKTYELADES